MKYCTKAQQTTDFKRIAAIDVGSNTIKMLAVDILPEGFSVLAQHSITVRLQNGLKLDGNLDDAAMQRAEDAIDTLVQIARELHVERIQAFGTSALRDASNAQQLIQRVKDRSRINLTVISGEEEARAAYEAISPAGRAMVVNPGGGSTEIIIGNFGRFESAVSAHVGAVSLMNEAYGMDLHDVEQLAKVHLQPAWEQLGDTAPQKVIASGGTATCAANVLLATQQREADVVEGFVISRTDAGKLLEKLFPMSTEERRACPGMHPQRADILPYGLAILTAFMDLTKTNALSISDKGNLYGFIKRMMQKS